MRKIKLIRMTLKNFKGAKERTVEFSGNAQIGGANGTGKSTIYEAYLWCLFNKNAYGNETKVQPLDANNEPLHNLETSVKITLDVDGGIITLERRLKEDWVKPRGGSDLILKGTTSTYFINDVPKSLKEFNDKLNDLCDVTRWFWLSSINIIPSMDQKARRMALQSIAPAFDEMALAAKFPAVLDAMKRGITADELLITTKNDKSRAKQELDAIPARIDEIEKLRVDMDFSAIKVSLSELEAELKKVREEIEVVKHPESDELILKQSEAQRKELAKLTEQVTDLEIKARNKESGDRSDRMDECNSARSRVNEANRNWLAYTNRLKDNEAELARLKDLLSSYRASWIAKNSEEKPDFAKVCPTCGQMLPANKIAEAEAAWNLQKTKAMKELEEKAGDVKGRIAVIEEKIEADKGCIVRFEGEQKLANAHLASCEAGLSVCLSYTSILANDKAYQDVLKQRNELREKIADAATKRDAEVSVALEPLKERERDLTARIEDLRNQLASEKTNDRIDGQRIELDSKKATYADEIAKCEKVEAQVAEFKKEKIAMIEENVSRLFRMVHWKMYEPNLTNDGEKEICQAIIEGVPFEQQNTATKFNAAIDMVSAFSTAYEVRVPLFVDNSESVTNIIDAQTQTITLQVMPGSEFNIINF